MENLTKTQIILLAILISFIVSIATGIVTVALLEQAPAEVPQTINRVIKQTIEKVVPAETKTVIIKEEDLVVDAVKKNQSSIVSVFKKMEDKPESLGLGFIISKDGLLFIENKNFGEGNYFIKIDDKELEAKLLANDPRGFSLFKVEPAKDLNYSTLSDSSKLRSGQTLVFLGEGVSRDIFSKQDKFSLPAEEGTEPISFDIIKVAKSISETPALVLDLDGDVVGFTVMIGEKSLILPSNLIKESLKI